MHYLSNQIADKYFNIADFSTFRILFDTISFFIAFIILCVLGGFRSKRIHDHMFLIPSEYLKLNTDLFFIYW